MIRSRGLEEKMRQQRAEAKTLDNLFRRRIEAGAAASLSWEVRTRVRDVSQRPLLRSIHYGRQPPASVSSKSVEPHRPHLTNR
jgi:hypothetical protein